MTKSAAVARDQDHVLKAAARLFREKGFAAATVREIAATAGMLPGSLHYRYPTKEDLLLALMERAIQQATTAIQGATAGCVDPIERVRMGIRAHLRLLLDGGDAVYVLLHEWRALEGRAREEMIRLRDRYEAMWNDLLLAALATGRVKPEADPHLVRLLGFGAINGVAQWYRPGGHLTPEQVADAFFDAMAFGLLQQDASH